MSRSALQRPAAWSGGGTVLHDYKILAHPVQRAKAPMRTVISADGLEQCTSFGNSPIEKSFAPFLGTDGSP